MANKKRALATYRENLGRFHLDRKDILVIEKILKEYAAVYDETVLNRFSDSEHKRRVSKQTRKFADVHVKVGRWKSRMIKFGWDYIEIDYTTVRYIYDADSIKFLPKHIRSSRYFKVGCQPGIWLRISPLKCELIAQRHNAGGKQMMAMNKAVRDIEAYLSGCKKSIFNRVMVV